MTGSQTSRRRFLAISAAAIASATLPVATRAEAHVYRWQGIALGAAAEIRLLHTDSVRAHALLAAAETEIRRLEAIFNLYRTDSALVRLNRDGRLDEPPLDLVELLGLAARIHRATDGAFDPSIQPLWALHADCHADKGRPPSTAEIDAVRDNVGFDAVTIEAGEIRLGRKGMALTLNGIAQGFVTDRIATLLRAGGMTDLLVDMGEIRASGNDGRKDGWRVRLDPERSADPATESLTLVDRAVASSARHGTTFDADGTAGHILDPRTGRPATEGAHGASVVAATAAVADGLSTAALICGEHVFDAALKSFPGARARLSGSDGTARWLDG
ncbi:FAD:protein FMN transferase [Polymorphum gilvum]|uniref:FAD:protein FMN transferase n=1 Tax=Polymorphum gilvum (strain LMG 25793 / CGMCC 1.9160 / SL003B-26A1) TaxID=991905 RepID=F2J4Q0_POLGS|nr:FAD:protein FMN transferase [Polymorphum gilvum]ADZ68992.1 Nitrous oxide reductase accessory protein NosX (Required for nitrous oxide reduction), ApbE-like lipoprotein [Polymorphum gilvum SL003B-26A1]